MSVVVAVVRDDCIFVGADSAITDDGGMQYLRLGAKIFQERNHVFALTGDADHTILLRRFFRHSSLEVRNEDDIFTLFESFMEYLDHLSTYDKKERSDPSFFVANKHGVWITHGYYVAKIDDHDALGCGAAYAQGALFVSNDIKQALRAACYNQAHCSLPAIVYSIPKNGDKITPTIIRT